MIQITPQMRILLAVRPADFRKGIDDLSQVCRGVLRSDPFSGHVFMFRNKRATAIKVLRRCGHKYPVRNRYRVPLPHLRMHKFDKSFYTHSARYTAVISVIYLSFNVEILFYPFTSSFIEIFDISFFYLEEPFLTFIPIPRLSHSNGLLHKSSIMGSFPSIKRNQIHNSGFPMFTFPASSYCPKLSIMPAIRCIWFTVFQLFVLLWIFQCASIIKFINGHKP